LAADADGLADRVLRVEELLHHRRAQQDHARRAADVGLARVAGFDDQSRTAVYRVTPSTCVPQLLMP
jgi:hypothetical protein